jgi:hypothetical protein
MSDLETFWANLLSGDPEVIRAAWENLDSAEQAAVRAHLESMATEDGWSEPRQLSARAALVALQDTPASTKNR